LIELKDIIPKVKEALEKGKGKKFSQSYDLSVSFKQIDFKNPNNAIEEVAVLPKGRGKEVRICGLVDKELQTEAKANCYKVVMAEEFNAWKDDSKKIKKLADECDYFIAQANIMPKIAQAFGKILGPRRKMPNPKAGCLVAPTSKLEPVVQRLSKSVQLTAKKAPVINIAVGTDKMPPEDVAQNIFAVIDVLIRRLPAKEQNIKHVTLKTTMGECVKIM
jgi:large subunit ribosomal protein L1